MISARRLLILLFLFTTGLAGAASTSDQQFLWEAANNKLAKASSPREYADAARAYGPVIEAGLENADVYYNLGTALLLSEEYPSAIHALNHAQLYQGYRTDLQRNLTMARSRIEDTTAADTSWQTTLFTLHYNLSAEERHVATALSVCFLFLILSTRVWLRFRLFPLACCLSLILTLMCISSSLYTLIKLNTPYIPGPYVAELPHTEDAQ